MGTRNRGKKNIGRLNFSFINHFKVNADAYLITHGCGLFIKCHHVYFTIFM